jgi:hypothetical protein
MKFDRMSALLLLVLGVLTIGTGIYFLFVRPVMLPEDIRLTATAPELLRPEMVDWLRIVFRTWGGFIAGFGILMVSVATYMITSRAILLSCGVVLAILVAFGQFLVSNIAIRSDFLWFVGVLFTLAMAMALRVAGLALSMRRRANGRSR